MHCDEKFIKFRDRTLRKDVLLAPLYSECCTQQHLPNAMFSSSSFYKNKKNLQVWELYEFIKVLRVIIIDGEYFKVPLSQ